MQVFAYCAEEFEGATARAAGVVPLTSPPFSRKDAHELRCQMQQAEFVYLDLHGAPGGTCWLGGGHVAALCAQDLTQRMAGERNGEIPRQARNDRVAWNGEIPRQARNDRVAWNGEVPRQARNDGILAGTVVFAANCHLANRDSPMMDALLDAGARMVVAGEGPNAGPSTGRLYGAPLLGLWFRRILAMGMAPLLALTWAKRVVRVDEVLVGGEAAAADVDAVGFRAYVRRRTTDDGRRKT